MMKDEVEDVLKGCLTLAEGQEKIPIFDLGFVDDLEELYADIFEYISHLLLFLKNEGADRDLMDKGKAILKRMRESNNDEYT